MLSGDSVNKISDVGRAGHFYICLKRWASIRFLGKPISLFSPAAAFTPKVDHETPVVQESRYDLD